MIIADDYWQHNTTCLLFLVLFLRLWTELLQVRKLLRPVWKRGDLHLWGCLPVSARLKSVPMLSPQLLCLHYCLHSRVEVVGSGLSEYKLNVLSGAWWFFWFYEELKTFTDLTANPPVKTTWCVCALSSPDGGKMIRRCIRYTDCNNARLSVSYPYIKAFSFRCCTNNLCNSAGISTKAKPAFALAAALLAVWWCWL